MSRYEFYESMCFNGRPGGPGYQTTYPPLLYAHDPSIPVKDEPESDSSYPFHYSDASGHSSEYSLSPTQMASDMDEKSPSPQPQPSYAETESFLRKYLRIFEPRPLNLYSLPDGPDPGYKKPSIVALIALAIWGSLEKKLTLQQIYEAIEERYPSWSVGDKPWQRSIRHSLSLKAMFRHENREGSANAKGGIWYINFAYGDGDKRIRHRSATKDGSQSSASERESDKYEPVSSPQFAGNQRHSDPDSSAPRGTVSRRVHARSSSSNFHDQYTSPYPEQMGNSYNGQFTGTALEYHQSHLDPGPMTNSGISYTFVPEGMRDERIPQENASMTGPNIIYSFYPDSMTAPIASSQLQSMAYTTSTMPRRRHTDPPRDMESQMPRRTPRSRRTD